jgi:hypothetical protein
MNIRYHITEQGLDQGKADVRWKNVFERLVFLKCLVSSGFILTELVWI